MQYIYFILYISHSQTHTGSFNAILASVFVFFKSIFIFTSALLIQSRLLSCPTGSFICLSVLTLLLFSFSLPPSFSFLSLSVSFLVSVFHSPHPSLTLYLSVVLSLTQLLLVSHPPLPLPLPLLFLTLSLSLFIFLSSLPSLTQSISHPPVPLLPLSSFFHLLPQSPFFTHSLTLFFLSVSPSLCLTALKAVIINDMVIRASRFPFSFLALSLSLCPPPHFSFSFLCLCLSVSLLLFYSCQSLTPSFPCVCLFLLKLKSVFHGFQFSTNQGTSSLEVIMYVNDFLSTHTITCVNMTVI